MHSLIPGAVEGADTVPPQGNQHLSGETARTKTPNCKIGQEVAIGEEIYENACSQKNTAKTKFIFLSVNNLCHET